MYQGKSAVGDWSDFAADFPPLDSQQTSVAALSADPVPTAAPTATGAAAVHVPRKVRCKTAV